MPKITDGKRSALRTYYQSHQCTQREAQEWYYEKFREKVSQGSVSNILSQKYARLDEGKVEANRMRSRGPRWPVLEKVLHEKILLEEESGLLHGEQILTFAKEIWASCPQLHGGDETPKFTASWLTKFKKRVGIKLRKKHEERGLLPACDTEQMNQIRRIVKDYHPRDVYNMDESGLFWKRGPSSESATRSLPGMKPERSRISFTVCCNGDGSHKLPIHFVGKPVRPAKFTDSDLKNTKWKWTSNKCTWMTTDLMLDWLAEFYGNIESSRHVLLLLDDFYAHRCAVAIWEIPPNVEIQFLPPAYHPLRQGIVDNMKRFYLKCLLEAQLEFLQARSLALEIGVHPPKVSAFVSIRLAVTWISQAWDVYVELETITNCFKKSTLFSETYSTEAIPPLDLENISILFHRVIHCGKVRYALSIRDFMNPEEEDTPPVSWKPSTEELVWMHTADTEVVEEEEAEESESETETPTWREILKNLVTTLSHLQQRKEFTEEEISSISKLVSKTGSLYRGSLEQNGTTDHIEPPVSNPIAGDVPL